MSLLINPLLGDDFFKKITIKKSNKICKPLIKIKGEKSKCRIHGIGLWEKGPN